MKRYVFLVPKVDIVCQIYHTMIRKKMKIKYGPDVVEGVIHKIRGGIEKKK
jgi:hypothetical protein